LRSGFARAEHRQPQRLREHAQRPLARLGNGGLAAEQADGGDVQAGQQLITGQRAEEPRDLEIEHVDGGLAQAEQVMAAGGVADQVQGDGPGGVVQAALEDLPQFGQ
jgi:hypothetical protein